jgi:hypothetical protein
MSYLVKDLSLPHYIYGIVAGNIALLPIVPVDNDEEIIMGLCMALLVAYWKAKN